MNIAELIRRKREGEALTAEEVRYLVGGFVRGEIPDDQMSALLMAIFFRGMEPAEAASFARVMEESGDCYDLSAINRPKVDKHSTGGIGDKVSLILAPLVACAGAVDPMVSGRGLGHTGGTLDKLDSIPGYRWDLTEEEFRRQLDTVGCAIIGQTDRFVPADKKIYALRDVTATVESIPLICGSILSKKSAAGTDFLVMDVKCGSGAFMETREKARTLAEQLLAIGTQMGMRVSALLTRMDRPLGRAVGNSIEVLEAIDVLQGGGPEDTREITLALGAEMLLISGLAQTEGEARRTLLHHLDNGNALAKFQEWIQAQGGDHRIVDKPDLLPQTKEAASFRAPRGGFVESMNARSIGVGLISLGGGRRVSSDEVDPAVGLIFERTVGDRVEKGDEIARIYHRNGHGLEECRELLDSAVSIGESEPEPVDLILERLPPP